MIFKRLILIAGLLNFATALNLYAKSEVATTESDQQISDFSLAGYGERGRKSWDISGKSADIFTEVIKLKDVIGNMYGKEENIKLTADRGDFNKVDGKIHMEQNVIITTSSGTRLTTNSLDWDRKNQLVTTSDPVNIKRADMVVDAIGAKGETNLKKVALEKNIRLDITPAANQEKKDDQGKKDKDKDAAAQENKIIITCDGPLDIDYEKNIATFNNNVKVERQDSIIYSDKMDVYFISGGKEKKPKESEQTSSLMGSKIDKIIARGNVKIVRGQNVSYSDEAIYTASDKKITLTGRPKLVIYSTGDLNNASSGN
jgi:LPS export ABC transporter protein LptC